LTVSYKGQLSNVNDKYILNQYKIITNTN
jgi:hypothetical protein